MSLLTSLISYYTFNSTPNDTLGLYNFTNSGATYGPGVIDNGTTFNGSSTYMRASNKIVPTGNFSITLWIKNGNAAQPQDSVVFSNQNDSAYSGVCLGRNYAGTVNAYSLMTGNGSSWISYGTNTFAISTTNWEFYAFTYDGSIVSIYRNATLIASYSNTSLSMSSAKIMALGIYPDQQIRFWSGSIDEMGVWGRSLTSTEISQLYNNGAGLSYPFSTGNSSCIIFCGGTI